MNVNDTMDGVPGVLFLPFAGAHRNSYSAIEGRLRDRGIWSRSLELPGHGSRFGEPLCRSVDDMCTDLSRQITEMTAGPQLKGIPRQFILAGHSMGALLAWRLTDARPHQRVAVVGLLLSGRRGPGAPQRRADLHTLPYEDFIRAIGRFGGSPPEVIHNDDLMELLEPILRADFSAIETSAPLSVEPVRIPVQVLVGDRDSVTREDAEKWREITSDEFQLHVQVGGHFHLLEQPEDTVEKILRLIDIICRRENTMQPTNISHSDS